MNKKNGFTLVELAIALLIIALLLGGLIMGLSAQIEQRRVSETQKGLDDIKEALIGYATNQPLPHLPCPDKTTVAGVGTANDGIEDVTVGGLCVTQEGNIPWVTLGVSDVDSWGRHFHYRVSPAYSNRNAGTTFGLATSGVLTVCKSSPSPAGLACAPANTAIANNIPAIILSYGKNGLGAITASGAAMPTPTPPVPPAINSDEYENTNLDNIFVSRPPSAVGGTLGEFDDQVTWLTSGILNSRMISAQKLP